MLFRLLNPLENGKFASPTVSKLIKSVYVVHVSSTHEIL